MSNIKATETKPEILVRKFLFANGFRYRKNVKDLPGKPDIVLPKYNTVIFVNGCFWHDHKGCKKAALPTTNISFWEKKIGSNIIRDKRKILELKKLGWNVITFWQCKLNEKNMKNLINKIKRGAFAPLNLKLNK